MLLKFFRKKLRVILWATIIGIIPAFIFLYGYSRSQSPSPYILAKVDGTPIYVKDFYEEINQIAENYPFIKEPRKIKELAYQRLLEKAILLKEARKYRVKVTREEIVQFLKALPYFKDKKGNFRPEYLENLSDEELKFLESIARENILIGKMKSLVTSRIEVSDKEVEKRYREEKTKYTLLIIEKEPENKLINAVPDEEELKNFMEKDKDRFRIGPLYKIAWIKIKDEEFYPEIKVSEEEIKDYYNKNLDEFKDSDTEFLPLDEVKHNIEKRIRERKARKKAKDEAFNLSIELIDVKDWEKALQGKRKVNTTGWIKGEEVYPLVGVSVVQFHNLPKGESSEPLRVQDGYVVLKLIDEKLVETTNKNALEDQIRECLDKLSRADDFDIDYSIAPVRNIVPHPHIVSIYVAAFVIEKLIDHKDVVDIFGSDQDIYFCVNQQVKKFLP